MEKDLDLLRVSRFPHYHKRAKLAHYYCNSRITYLLRALALSIFQTHLQDLDAPFYHFIVVTFCFEDNYAHSPYAVQYPKPSSGYALALKMGSLA